jgi:hypothetical protein
VTLLRQLPFAPLADVTDAKLSVLH